MGLTANTNISSIAAARAVYESRDDLTRAMERLSSGKRINSSRDDAAGQTVVSRMRAQITSLNQAIRNANDGLSMVQTYEGAADEIEDMLIRMRELATLVQNGTYNTADGANADLEYKQLKAEIDRIQSKTKFNGSLDISSSVAASNQTYSFQVGFNGGDAVSIAFGSLEASGLAGGTVAHGFTNGFSAAAQASQITHAASAVTVADAMQQSEPQPGDGGCGHQPSRAHHQQPDECGAAHGRGAFANRGRGFCGRIGCHGAGKCVGAGGQRDAGAGKPVAAVHLGPLAVSIGYLANHHE